ncbi:hypothetical protein [Flavobacterium sp. K5-23]|uniref:hypothetical protein n=1 Tax=Flavobacterium sp. K5-23 TaxID=2746225 RepID=UPI00200EC579|nr:hypothetical protein [Flavobacterium sp. K5-23]UQD57534.1 hypothetical protein FLAK523_14465 [Flavobacterium sp. K5-23]
MKAVFTIERVTTINEIPSYWSKEDYFALLKEFGLPVANTISENECIEYLQMAVSELEPNESAQVLLTYKLSEYLNENQIEQISNDMLIDKISEEYPEINLHYDLYSINQLLFKLYNGKFPNAKASLIELLVEINDYSENLTKDEVLRNLMKMSSDSIVIKRLFSDKLEGDEPFEEANDIIWKLDIEGNHYKIYTSEYWIANEEIITSKIETEFEPIVIE